MAKKANPYTKSGRSDKRLKKGTSRTSAQQNASRSRKGKKLR